MSCEDPGADRIQLARRYSRSHSGPHHIQRLGNDTADSAQAS
jgi:hypothetical protein